MRLGVALLLNDLFYFFLVFGRRVFLCLLLLGIPRMIPCLVPRLAVLLWLLVFGMPVVCLLLLWLLRPLGVVLSGGVILAMTDEIC